jgi:hypothetical protein
MEGTRPDLASHQLQSDTSGPGEFGLEGDLYGGAPPAAGAAQTHVPPAVEVTVEDLVFLNVPLAWQEAAALVVELASVVPSGAVWPDPAHAILLPTGEIVPAPQVILGGNPVRHAAELLERLLALTRLAPAELKVLVNKNIGERPAHLSLESFRKALGYFTRPNRLDDTAAVHGRAADLLQKRLLEREFDRVRHKSIRALAQEGEAPRFSLLRRMSPEWLQGALVVVLCLMLVASGTALVSMAMWQGPLPWSPPRPDAARRPPPPNEIADAQNARVNATVRPAPAAGTPGRMSSGGVPAPTPPKGQVSVARPLPQTPGDRSGAGSPPNRQPSVDAGRDRFWSVTVREVAPDATRAAAVPGSALFSGERSQELFGPADLEVEPAALVRPQMPSPHAPFGDKRDSVFDLVIDQNGRVEQVRLVSPANRFNDRMLIAAAKAWQFLPATKKGLPVRYKLQLRIAP